MTPDDLRLIQADASSIDPEPFATAFYATLFEVAPQVRSMFPTDMADQRRKLMTELTTMIQMATSVVEGDLDRFTTRAHRLGARHVDYGAVPAHYDAVGAVLLATLADSVGGWDPHHEAAWTRLYAIVAATMQQTPT